MFQLFPWGQKSIRDFPGLNHRKNTRMSLAVCTGSPSGLRSVLQLFMAHPIDPSSHPTCLPLHGVTLLSKRTYHGHGCSDRTQRIHFQVLSCPQPSYLILSTPSDWVFQTCRPHSHGVVPSWLSHAGGSRHHPLSAL